MKKDIEKIVCHQNDLPTIVGRCEMRPRSVAGLGAVQIVKRPDSCSRAYCNLDADTIHESRGGSSSSEARIFLSARTHVIRLDLRGLQDGGQGRGGIYQGDTIKIAAGVFLRCTHSHKVQAP